MAWKIAIERSGELIAARARDPEGRRQDASLAPGAPPRLTLAGAGPLEPCRFAEALDVTACLVDVAPTPPAELIARRRAPVGAPLTRESRLRAAAELDRLSGIVADELEARGATFAEMGLAPVLHLRAGGASAPVRLGTLAEMRARFADALRRRGLDADSDALEIAALEIAAYAPAPGGAAAAEPGEPWPEAPLREVGGPGPTAVRLSDRVLLVEAGWRVAPTPEGLRLSRL